MQIWKVCHEIFPEASFLFGVRILENYVKNFGRHTKVKQSSWSTLHCILLLCNNQELCFRHILQLLHKFLSPYGKYSAKVDQRHAQFSCDSLLKSHQASCFIRKFFSKTISLLCANESDDTWDWKWFQAKENRRKPTRFDGKRCQRVDLLLSTAYSLIKEFPKPHLLGNLLSCPRP